MILCWLALAVTTIAQTTGEIAGTMDLPPGTEKLSKEQFEAFVNEHFGRLADRDYDDHIFRKGDVIISYRSHQDPTFQTYTLEKRKKEFVGLLSDMGKKTVTNANIIKVNNAKFLVIEFYRDKDYGILFFSDTDSQKRFVNGTLYFNQKDQEAARLYLDFMLNHFRFTETK